MIDYDKLKQVNIMNEDIGKYYLSIRIYRNEILAIELARKPEFMKDIYCDQFFNTDIDALFEFLSKIQLKEEPRYKVGDEVFVIAESNSIYSYRIKNITPANKADGNTHWYGDGNHMWHEINVYPTRQSLITSQIEYWQSMLEHPTPGDIIRENNEGLSEFVNKMKELNQNEKKIMNEMILRYYNECQHEYKKGICIQCGDENLLGDQFKKECQHENNDFLLSFMGVSDYKCRDCGNEFTKEECQHESDGKAYFQTPEGSESLPILCKCKKCGEFYK